MDELIFIYCYWLLLLLVAHRWYMYIITNMLYSICNNMQLYLYVNIDFYFQL